MRRALSAAVAVAATALLGTAGCSGGSAAAPQVPPSQRLAAAKRVLDEARYVQLTLSSKDVPADVNGVTGATGVGVVSSTEPRFKGSITGTVKGIAGTVDLICIGDAAYMKFFTPDYVETDLATLGAPNPSVFFNPDKGVSTLLTDASDPAKGEQIRSGDEVLDRYTGTVPGSRIKQLFMLGDGTGTFTVTFGITAKDQLRTAVMTGAFFDTTTATYTLRLTSYGTAVEITRP
jgi:lipoprotein LprG